MKIIKSKLGLLASKIKKAYFPQNPKIKSLSLYCCSLEEVKFVHFLLKHSNYSLAFNCRLIEIDWAFIPLSLKDYNLGLELSIDKI